MDREGGSRIEIGPLRNPQGPQVDFYSLKSRYTVGLMGRQWGKTTTALLRMARRASKLPGLYMWCSPIYRQARECYLKFQSEFAPIIKKSHESHLEIIIYAEGGESRIKFRGVDMPDSLRGDALMGATLDEAAMMRSNVWPEIIRPMLMVNHGWADFISTPKGKNWFFDLYTAAMAGGEWRIFHAPSNTSPFVTEEEFEEIRRNTPERVFRQEYMAEFLDDDSEVFRGIRQCIHGGFEQPARHRHYIMGVDLAKHVDWTVITVWDVMRKHLVYFERFNQIDWTMQESKILDVTKTYNNAPIVLDSTGVGDSIYDRLSAAGANVIPVRFTSAVKQGLVTNLRLAIEKRDITFPEIPQLISELQIFSASTNPRTGNVSYSAPDGYHDDCVMSVALAVSELAIIPTDLRVEAIGSTYMSDFQEV